MVKTSIERGTGSIPGQGAKSSPHLLKKLSSPHLLKKKTEGGHRVISTESTAQSWVYFSLPYR